MMIDRFLMQNGPEKVEEGGKARQSVFVFSSTVIHGSKLRAQRVLAPSPTISSNAQYERCHLNDNYLRCRCHLRRQSSDKFAHLSSYHHRTCPSLPLVGRRTQFPEINRVVIPSNLPCVSTPTTDNLTIDPHFAYTYGAANFEFLAFFLLGRKYSLCL